MARLLIVSNRCPVTVRVVDGQLRVERSAGGLATGLTGPHQRSGGLWIGWPARAAVRPGAGVAATPAACGTLGGAVKAMWLRTQAPIGTRPLEPIDLPEPAPGPGEVRVRVRACGICRTDLHVVEGDLPPRRLPVIPGHQAVGLVDGLGAGAARFRVGDRVGIAWLRWTCGACALCRAGRENLCEGSRYTGYHEHGGYAAAAVVPEAYAYRIPAGFSDLEAAPLLCAGIIGYRALARSQLPPGGTLGLYGFGSSAHVVLQVARHRGATVFVATRGERHRRLAARLGAAWVGGAADAMPAPLDAAIVFAPAGEIVPAALRAVRKGGTVALAGIYMTPLPDLDYEACLFHEKTLTSVEASTRQDGEALLREAASIPIRPEVTAFPLAEANQALARLKDDQIEGTGVLVLDPGAARSASAAPGPAGRRATP